ncbi:hypothetical protein SAMN05444008_117104 [Cnuella takakiae]|uniref:Uncharacterized protein n=1 Tax=Cnuella takakiae TaxID=1302690 RepID=A0A1M5GY16_9BACT|nr:hypothetical protein [Cnuella takakiae]SHG08567.1 hypothetical protein SAMN05444008_117104 [Cnuella takakiae]
MSNTTAQPKHLLAFLREHRGNEANFQQINEQIGQALQEEWDAVQRESLQEVQDKYAGAYTTAREQGGSAWPEFERYVSELEKCLLAADKAA